MSTPILLANFSTFISLSPERIIISFSSFSIFKKFDDTDTSSSKYRSINVELSDDDLNKRRKEMQNSKNPWQPQPRERKVSAALKAYAMMATSASQGAVRDLSQIEVKHSK